MSNELATLDLNQLPSTQLGSDEAYTELAKGGDFLKYAKLYTKGKPIDSGLIPPGHWGTPETDEEITDLGNSIDILPLARRPKALDSSDKSAVIVSYDETSEAFQQIKAQSDVKDSGCQHGISFLVIERSTGQFLELWLGNKSSRPEARRFSRIFRLARPTSTARQRPGPMLRVWFLMVPCLSPSRCVWQRTRRANPGMSRLP